MVESTGVILRGGMKISLARVTGIARFGKQCQVGQAKAGDQRLCRQESRLMFQGRLPGKGKNANTGDSQAGQQQKSQG